MKEILNEFAKFFESMEHIRFQFKRKQPSIFSKIINKNNVVAIIIKQNYRGRTLHIRVDYIKRFITNYSRVFEGKFVTFITKARITQFIYRRSKHLKLVS